MNGSGSMSHCFGSIRVIKKDNVFFSFGRDGAPSLTDAKHTFLNIRALIKHHSFVVDYGAI